MNGWISLKDKMPDDFDDVLVSTSAGKRTIAWQESDDPNWYQSANDEVVQFVTYWMPLPDPPCKENSEKTATV